MLRVGTANAAESEPSAPDGDVSQDELLEFIKDLLADHPWQVFSAALLGSAAALVGMGVVVWAISRAGRYNPPVVVVTVVLGVVTMLALVALVLQPEIQALAVAVGSGIGGLAGAITLAMERNKSYTESPAQNSATLTKAMPHLRPDDDYEESESMVDQAKRAVTEAAAEDAPTDVEGEPEDRGG